MVDPQLLTLYKAALVAVIIMGSGIGAYAFVRAFAGAGEHQAGILQTVAWLHQGKKTYAVALSMIATTLVQHYAYGQPIDWNMLLQGLGLAALRAGVTKSGPNGTTPKEGL